MSKNILKEIIKYTESITFRKPHGLAMPGQDIN